MGDAVLKRAASVVRRVAPSPRLAFRYGGEEFVVLTDRANGEARELAERVRMDDRRAERGHPGHHRLVRRGRARRAGRALGGTRPRRQRATGSEALRAKPGGSRRAHVARRARSARRGARARHSAARRDGARRRDARGARHRHGRAFRRRLDALRGDRRRLGFDDEALQQLLAGAQLHDVGKVAIPSAILNKPGALTDDEWAVIREHTVIGERILRSVPEMAEVATIVRHSHEHWDGSGYPDGLAGEQHPAREPRDPVRRRVPRDALRPALPRGRPAADAIAELEACAGTQFDPAVVDAFVEVSEETRTRRTPSSWARATGASSRCSRRSSSAAAALSPASREVRDALRSVFGASTAADRRCRARQLPAEDFGFGPLGDVLEPPTARVTASARSTTPSLTAGTRRRSRPPGRASGAAMDPGAPTREPDCRRPAAGSPDSRRTAGCTGQDSHPDRHAAVTGGVPPAGTAPDAPDPVPQRARRPPARARRGDPTTERPKPTKPSKGNGKAWATRCRLRGSPVSRRHIRAAGPTRRRYGHTEPPQPNGNGQRQRPRQVAPSARRSRRRAASASARRRAAGSPAAAGPSRGPSRPPRPARAGPGARPSPCRSASKSADRIASSVRSWMSIVHSGIVGACIAMSRASSSRRKSERISETTVELPVERAMPRWNARSSWRKRSSCRRKSGFPASSAWRSIVFCIAANCSSFACTAASCATRGSSSRRASSTPATSPTRTSQPSLHAGRAGPARCGRRSRPSGRGAPRARRRPRAP